MLQESINKKKCTLIQNILICSATHNFINNQNLNKNLFI